MYLFGIRTSIMERRNGKSEKPFLKGKWLKMIYVRWYIEILSTLGQISTSVDKLLSRIETIDQNKCMCFKRDECRTAYATFGQIILVVLKQHTQHTPMIIIVGHFV